MSHYSYNLTDVKVKSAKSASKDYKLTDGKGLHLLVKVNGTKCWRYNFKLHGKWKTYSLGVYPEISLSEAREEHKKAHGLVAKGEDPNLVKLEKRMTKKYESNNTFEFFARKWLEKRKGKIKDKTWKEISKRLEKNLYPEIGHLPVNKISPQIMLNALQKIEVHGAHSTVRRCRLHANQIFTFISPLYPNIANPTSNLSPWLESKEVKHQKSMPFEELPSFLVKIEMNVARLYEQTNLSLKLMTHTFTRKAELTGARWTEIDFEEKIWIIPKERMKMKRDHIVPLSNQSIKILQRLFALNGHLQYVFVGINKPKNPMHPDTPLKALYALKYKGIHTVHGFRSLAATALRERLNYGKEVIDVQLAHAKKGSLGSAYDRAEYLEERKKMMQDWSDLIDKKLNEGLTKRF